LSESAKHLCKDAKKDGLVLELMQLDELMEAGGDHLRRKGVARIAAGEHHHGNKTAMREESARDSE
jgi:hypothetical protein